MCSLLDLSFVQQDGDELAEMGERHYGNTFEDGPAGTLLCCPINVNKVPRVTPPPPPGQLLGLMLAYIHISSSLFSVVSIFCVNASSR